MSRLWTGHRDIDLVCEIIFRKLQMYFSIFIFRFSKLNLVGIIIDRFRYQILLIIHKKWPNIHFCTIFWQWTIYEIYNRPKLGMFAPTSSPASLGRRRPCRPGFPNPVFSSWDPWFLSQMFAHQARRPWTKTRKSATTIRRDSKIRDDEDVDVLRSSGWEALHQARI